ncbi:baeRF2 domain-containing protein [Pseudonocardia phyllosphaerae]|uniref:baeRF2 domain-containing protein n=1 Tax=Pseudonocardia phyllosphaerae TaxID=3390502 RepID=UPI00397B3BCB
MRLDWIRPLTETDGPFATVVLDATHDTAEATEQYRLRWRDLYSRLADAGADEATLTVLDDAVTGADAPDGTAGRVLVAGPGGVLLDRHTEVPPERGTAAWGQVPDLLPLLAAVGEDVPTVVVAIDHTGGEIRAVDGEVETVSSDASGPVHKANIAGPGEGSADARVEETWKRNAQAVAERVDKLVRGGNAGLLVVAGDAPSRARLRDELSPAAAEVMAEIENTGGTVPEQVDDTVRAAADEVREQRRVAGLDSFRTAQGRSDGLAVTGLDAVVAATRAHAVETLLLDASATPGTEVVLGADASAVAISGADLDQLGQQATASATPADALIRAAAATDADVVLVRDGDDVPLDDGLGAVLRFPLGEQS